MSLMVACESTIGDTLLMLSMCRPRPEKFVRTLLEKRWIGLHDRYDKGWCEELPLYCAR
jgi:hypothetical protein